MVAREPFGHRRGTRPDGRLAAIPDSLPVARHRSFGGEGRFGIEMVVAADQLVVIDGWTRAAHEPIVPIEVHLPIPIPIPTTSRPCASSTCGRNTACT